MPDGKMLDATGAPEELHIGHALPALAEGLQLMSPGETLRLWVSVPDGSVYLRAGSGMVVYDLKLISVEKP